MKKASNLQNFKRAWIRKFGKPKSKQDRLFLINGIQDFYEDYLTSSRNLSNYLSSV